MHISTIATLIIGAVATASATPTPAADAAAAGPSWAFNLYMSDDCSGTPSQYSGNGNSGCIPPPAGAYKSVKVLQTGGGKCTVNFSTGGLCSPITSKSPGSIPADGKCHKVNTQSESVTCT